ncbi:MAG: hypothetical protein ACRC20_01795 [Segniliparus sp.]|uniref:hypothetical protein n=1 Tax=Segniliparus sp. TaxID=2804064 RepID=UPI003F3201F8
MSYYIFAFDPAAVPTDGELMPWFEEQAKWAEPRDYNDPAGSAPALQALYRDLIRVFPAMNGPDSSAGEPEDVDSLADYSHGSSILYVSFFWSKAEEAREVFVRLGAKHGVGVCEISETPVVIHRPTPGAPHTHTLDAITSMRSMASWLSPDPERAKRRLDEELERLGSTGAFGELRLAVVLSTIAAGHEYDEDHYTGEYIQAGGTAERLTVEVRMLESDGTSRQCTVGRAVSGTHEGSETLVFGNNQIVVRASEVLTAAEAIGLFRHYYEHHGIPEEWHLREVETDVPAAHDEDLPDAAPAEAGAGEEQRKADGP